MKPGGGGGSPERGTFFRLQLYEREGILLVEVYERVGESVIRVCERTQRTDQMNFMASILVIDSYLKGVPFANRRYTRGVPFS